MMVVRLPAHVEKYHSHGDLLPTTARTQYLKNIIDFLDCNGVLGSTYVSDLVNELISPAWIEKNSEGTYEFVFNSEEERTAFLLRWM